MPNSPGMDPIEKRRMQNRIAQRNHRQRAKENMLRIPTSKGNNTRNDVKQHGITSFNLIPENSDLLNQNSPGSLPTRNEGSQLLMSREETGSRSLAIGESPLLSQSGMDLHRENEIMLDNTLLKDLGVYSASMPPHKTVHQRLQTQDTSSGQKSFLRSNPDPSDNYPRWSCCGLSQPSNSSPCIPLLASQISTTALREHNVTRNQFQTPQSLPDVNPGLPLAATSTWPASPNGTAHQIPVMQYHETVDNESLSHHYQYVIDHVKRAGFESFDAMVSGYYTLSFTRNSAADRAQKVSRAKRLRFVLENLHKHSKEWTKWEARGFQEQTVQAAEGIYVAELGELQPGNDINIYGTVDDLPPSEIQKSQVLQNLQRLYENKVPNLWALFTDLAGASSPQTEDATILSLTLLHSINTNPELNLRETIINLVDKLL